MASDPEKAQHDVASDHDVAFDEKAAISDYKADAIEAENMEVGT